MSRKRSVQAPLALVCGAGAFPLAVTRAVKESGRQVFLIGIRGSADPGIVNYPHGWVGMGRLNRLLRMTKDAGATEICFVGSVPRPSFSVDFIPDLRFLKAAIRILGSGDNRMLTALADILADEGLKLRGVHEIAPQLMIPAGALGRRKPGAEALAAAKLGFKVLDALGPYDIGQGAVVADKRVIAVEAAEGTDDMLARIAALRADKRLKVPASRCVFAKAPKRGQELRLDTPAIGPETVLRAKAAGLSGIAVAAGQVMTPDLDALIAAADNAGLFVLGVKRKA